MLVSLSSCTKKELPNIASIKTKLIDLALTDSVKVENVTIDQLYVNNYSDNHIVLDEWQSKLFQLKDFNKSIFISSKGRGPSQYLGATLIIFDAQKSEFSIFDVRNAKLITFDDELNYISERSFKSEEIWLRAYISYTNDYEIYLAGIFEPKKSYNRNFLESKTIAVMKSDSIISLAGIVPNDLAKLDMLHVSPVSNQDPFSNRFIQTWLTEPIIIIYDYSKTDHIINQSYKINNYPTLFNILEDKPTMQDDMLTRRKEMTANSYVRSIYLVENKIYLLFSNYTMQGHLEQDSNLFEYFIAIYDLDQEKWIYEKQLDEIALAVDFQHRLYTNKVVGNDSWIKRYQISYEE